MSFRNILQKENDSSVIDPEILGKSGDLRVVRVSWLESRLLLGNVVKGFEFWRRYMLRPQLAPLGYYWKLFRFIFYAAASRW